MTDRGKADALRHALRVFGWIVLPLGLLWSPTGAILVAPSMALSGLIAAAFGGWLIIESGRSAKRSESDLALRVATAGQITAVLIVVSEPTIGFAVAVGSLIPIILALPYVRRESLTTLMAVSSAVGAFSLAAPSIIPWGSTFTDSLAFAVPNGAVVIVYVLFQLFLWNASTRLTDTTSELRHVIEMSHDLAATLEPNDVGHRLARHIAEVAHADDCVLSTWDHDNDRVISFGCYPDDRLDNHRKPRY